MPRSLTVGQFIHRLQTLDHDLPVYLAINPDWPYAHRVGQIVAVSEPRTGAVYIAEDGQSSVVPPTVRTALSWS